MFPPPTVFETKMPEAGWLAAFSPPARTESPQPPKTTVTVAIPAARIAARLVITATRLVEVQHSYANPPSEPRGALCPRRRSRSQLLRAGARLRAAPDGLPRRRLHARTWLDQRPRPGPFFGRVGCSTFGRRAWQRRALPPCLGGEHA